MRHRCLLVVLSLILVPVTAQALEAKFMRRPALSPDGSRIAFCWRGDLWVVPAAGGAARRLTVHPAYDTRPVWSPDGKTIAFSSNRFGNYDIFLMGASGGLPRRLTYHSGGDQPTCFTPDGTQVLFMSSRHKSVDWRGYVYQVPVVGGTPRKLFDAVGSEFRLSPDGKQLVLSRGVAAWHRKRYRGAAAHDLWLYNFASKRFSQLTEFAGNDDFACFGPQGKQVYFRSDRKGLADLWRLELATRKLTRMSQSRTQGIRALDVARRAPLAVYERWNDLYTLDLNSGVERRVRIEVPADERENRTHRRTFRSSGVSEFALSPDGKAVAFVIQGEVFLRELASPSKRAIQLTRTTSARESDLAWSTDNKLVFVSDRRGNNQLYQLAGKGGKPLWKTHRRSITQLTKGARHHSPEFSPDGKQLAYLRGAGDLMLRELATGKERLLVKSWNTHGYRFSPDGQWIAYNISDHEYNSDIWLIRTRGGAAINVTSHPDYDHNLSWSASGRSIVFASQRGKDSDIWQVYLRRADAVRSKVEWAPLLKKIKAALAAKQKKSKAKSSAKKASKAPKGPVGKQPPVKKKPAKAAGKKTDLLAVRVDGKEIFLRVRQISRLPGDEGNPVISPVGDTVLFTGTLGDKTAIYKVKVSGKGQRALVPNAGSVRAMRYGPLGRKVYYLGAGGAISTLDPASGKRGRVDFEARLLSNRQHIRQQKYDECWRLIHTRFYDPKFHGADWQGLRKKYRDMALATRHLTDFNYVIKMMLGELNASHLGISGPRQRGGVSERTGELGIDLEHGAAGPGVRVARVLGDGPSAAKLRVGDRILAVEGEKIGARTNFYRLLIDTAGQPTRLRIRRGDKSLDVIVRPAGSDRGLRYRDWVASRRALVDKLSGGKLGYIHIQGMNWPSLERFERDLYARAHSKQGLLIDVRYNGGGWTTDMLLVMLQTRAHAYTIGRGGKKGYPQGRRPFYVWQKPVGLLCNEMSFSNAEIFSHAFRTLKLGPVIGQPTYGAVISTGSATLIDGARFRIPGRGWYVLPKGQDMEYHAARPHHLVAQTPGSENAGTDPQLARAVKVLLERKK